MPSGAARLVRYHTGLIQHDDVHGVLADVHAGYGIACCAHGAVFSSRVPHAFREFATGHPMRPDPIAYLKRRVAETAIAAQLLDRHARLSLPEATDDLLFGESPLLHLRYSPGG